MDIIIALVVYYMKEIIGLGIKLKDLAIQYAKITILIFLGMLYFRIQLMKLGMKGVRMAIRLSNKLKDMLVARPMLAALLIGAIVYYVYKREQSSETFRYTLPNVENEVSCKDFGYVCSASSYKKAPELIQLCESNVMGPTSYYKLTKDTQSGIEVITSGLFHKYVMHHPGSLIRFSDGNYYKLLSRDPAMVPADCSIVNLKNEEYDKSDSSMPVQY